MARVHAPIYLIHTSLYLVNVDKNEDGYGVELYCAGIFDTREAAEEYTETMFNMLINVLIY